MIAQIGFSILLSGVMVYAWTEYRRAPVIAVLSMLVATAGLYLIIYVWVVISLILLLNLHLKLRSQAELITILMREIALANARTAEQNK